MEDQKFYIGDRVICIAEAPDGNARVHGAVGTIVDLYDRAGYGRYCVVWDTIVGGHSHNGKCKWGYGWRVESDDIELYVDTPEEPLTPASDESFASLIFGKSVPT